MNEAPADGRSHVGNPVKVFDAWNSFQAQLLEQELIAAGITARVASTAIEAITGKVPYQDASCPVWVAEEDEVRARDVVAAFERQWANRDATPVAEPFCYHCGGAVESGRGDLPPLSRCARLVDVIATAYQSTETLRARRAGWGRGTFPSERGWRGPWRRLRFWSRPRSHRATATRF